MFRILINNTGKLVKPYRSEPIFTNPARKFHTLFKILAEKKHELNFNELKRTLRGHIDFLTSEQEKRIRDLDPDRLSVLTNLARCYIYTGQKDKLNRLFDQFESTYHPKFIR